MVSMMEWICPGLAVRLPGNVLEEWSCRRASRNGGQPVLKRVLLLMWSELNELDPLKQGVNPS